MKNSIKLTALFLLASTGLFAATTPKAEKKVITPAEVGVIFSDLPLNRGVDVKLQDGATNKAIVSIFDQDGNVLRRDVLSNGKVSEKGYVLNKLDYGDYTIEVYSNGHTMKKSVHVYEEYQRKAFLIMG